MSARLLGTLVVFVLTTVLFGGGQSRRTYELIYDDLQVLKQRILQIEERLERNSSDLKSLRDQLQTLGEQIQRWQAGQFGLQEDLKSIPTNHHILLERIDQVQMRLNQVLAEITAVRLPAGPPGEIDPEKKTEADFPEDAPPGISPQEVFSAAYADYVNENFEIAAEGFRFYREQFPESPLTDTALYWMGECYFSLRRLSEAVAHFDELILNYPLSDKLPAAHLKKGLAFLEMGRTEEALAALKLLVGKYPLADESNIARQKIKEIKDL